MEPIKIKDNSSVPREVLSGLPHLIRKIEDKTLEELEREGLFVFPEFLREADDSTREQVLLKRKNDSYVSGNMMGFLGIGGEKLIIESRFSGGRRDYLFPYLLERVFDTPNIIDLETDADREERIFSLLVFVFPHYLRSAMRKGAYKTYIRNRYNDSHVKGVIEIPRHIAKNTPFIGNVAYAQREYSYDNDLMELARHVVEFIKCKPYGHKILAQVKEEVQTVILATPGYKSCDRARIMERNKTNVIRHAFYREYRELQNLCLLILQNQKHQIGVGNREIYGLLFDGAWLWEEYVNLLVKDLFYHPRNRARKEFQSLFSRGSGRIYPDFIGRNAGERVIADAKYKPVGNIHGGDYLQVLAYMLRFDARVGLYLYPEAGSGEDKVLWLNRGSTYEENVEPRKDVCVVKYGFQIPAPDGDYSQFSGEMKRREAAFRSGLLKYTSGAWLTP